MSWILEADIEAFFDSIDRKKLGVDLSRRQKPDRFREVGFGGAVRIERERGASAA